MNKLSTESELQIPYFVIQGALSAQAAATITRFWKNQKVKVSLCLVVLLLISYLLMYYLYIISAVVLELLAIYKHWTGIVDWTSRLDWWTDTKNHFYAF